MDEEAYKRLVNLKRRQQRSEEGFIAKRREEAEILMRRFEAAGWVATSYCEDEAVIVLDPKGRQHWWRLYDLPQVEECLMTLEEAERSALQTSVYDRMFQRIRQMTRRHQAAVKERNAEVCEEVGTIITRFVAAGWSSDWKPTCGRTGVEVRDLNGVQYEWYVENSVDLEDCLKALAEAERAK